MTDVTGVGLLGHRLEMARGAKLTLVIRARDVSVLAEAQLLSSRVSSRVPRRGTGQATAGVTLPRGCADWQRHLLTDPQASGGLLIACTAGRADAMLRTIIDAGYASARIVGHIEAGVPAVRVEA